MATLGQLGVNGLLAVNSWLGMINSNLQGASRTAYKSTRPVLSDGSVTRLGSKIEIPSATLNVQATSLEWGQGSINSSTQKTHFAIDGEGFFVLADDAGRYYLTRDGEFHWGGDGYLRNSNGLRVVSTGQDFIRRSNKDRSDSFDPDGESLELLRYGDKSLLIVDMANRQGLKMSQYGSTVFEVAGDIPFRVQNNFDTSTDGITFLYRDPKQRTFVDAPDLPEFVAFDILNPALSNFQIDLGGNGIFDFQAFTGTPFDPSVHTIQNVITEINNYAAANNAEIVASFDTNGDRFLIRNVPEPKIVDPNFRFGNFAIDFGDNGLFTYQGFDTQRTTIQNIVDQINSYGAKQGGNIVANFNPATDQLTITNTAAVNNAMIFDGANGEAVASLFRLNINNPNTAPGANAITSAGDIDRSIVSLNAFVDITAQDVTSTSLAKLLKPDSSIRFSDLNGRALHQFFRLPGDPQLDAGLNGFAGSRLESRRDIDNSNILDLQLPNRHSLDIVQADLATKTFNQYIVTTDNSGPAFDPSGPPATYTHDKVNDRIISDGSGVVQGRGLLAIGQAQQTDAFDLVLDYRTTTSLLEVHFGQDREEQIDSRGYTLQYDPSNGDLRLLSRNNDPNSPPVLLVSQAGVLPVTTGLATTHRLAMTLNKQGEISFSVDGVTRILNVSGDSDDQFGHLTLGHAGGRLELYNLYANFKGLQNMNATGEMVAVGAKPYATFDVNPAGHTQSRPRIVQSALESSNASLTEYIPMLGLVQKVFTALSKIITISNNVQDDLNSLIR